MRSSLKIMEELSGRGSHLSDVSRLPPFAFISRCEGRLAYQRGAGWELAGGQLGASLH